jgi:hypothetical protein
MCRCAQRRRAIVDAARAVVKGDLSQVAPAARFNFQSGAQDLRAGLGAAKARLKRAAGR